MRKNSPRLIPIFGDQLSIDLSALQTGNVDTDVILMQEVDHEATKIIQHHPKKIILIFSAMRHFAEQLKALGWQVVYLAIDDPSNQHHFIDNIRDIAKQRKISAITATEPSEYRVLNALKSLADSFSIQILNDDRFYCDHETFNQWAKDRKTYRMEYFYREMRKKTGILMEGNHPIGGKWNYDVSNRKSINSKRSIPKEPDIEPDEITQALIQQVSKRYKHYGHCTPFTLAVTREQALQLLDNFIKERLSLFGDYQDAMLDGEYVLFHSNLSMYLNIGLLSAKDVLEQVELAYHKNLAPLNAAEGYIRQVLGWREYIRGMYWLFMPTYKQQNFLEHHQPLPEFYWTGETDMACMRHCIQQSLHTATSHHIQRLMVTGNFAILFGVLPEAISEWYLTIYADAFEWVELPNTIGMSQYADGGKIASKPYISSGNYINKMSNFCKNCRYKVKEKLTNEACPFNFLYWDFLIRHAQIFRKNERMRMSYRHVDRMSNEDKNRIQKLAKDFIQQHT